MKPRIYLYKITFEGRNEWYWGIHKEKTFDEYYMGSPCTHKHFWSLYSPLKQIIEIFDYSEDGWKRASLMEQELIKMDINNPLCLNESYGPFVSSKVVSDRNKRMWQDPAYREKMKKAASQSNKLRWQDEDFKEKMLAQLRSTQRKAVEMSKSPEAIGKRIKTRGTPIRILEVDTGNVKEFPSLRSARSYYCIGMKKIICLHSGELSEYRGLRRVSDD